MVHIKIKKGLDIPIMGKPSGRLQPFIPRGEGSQYHPREIALSLKPFENTKFRMLTKPGDIVKIGQPLAFDKSHEERMFVSPAAGVVKELRRGFKRRLLDIVIEVAKQEDYQELPPLEPKHAPRKEILEHFNKGGLFAHIRSRPFNRLANPEKEPRNIFVKAIESAPFSPPAEMHVEGYEDDFQTGLTALSKLTSGKVHLVYDKDSTCIAFTSAKDVEKHTAEGPHPIGAHSVHIHYIDPIHAPEDIVWTVTAADVVIMGHLLRTGRYLTERVVSVAGPGILPEQSGYFKIRAGYPISPLIEGRIEKRQPLRLISGNPLTGEQIEANEFLRFYDTVFCAIPENTSREFLHFFRLGLGKYSFSKAYATGHFDNSNREYSFNTNQHGEHRAFVDPTLYDKVMPLEVPTMQLVKAVMAEDFDLAQSMGLLEVDSEDFALPTFVCPSKMEMIEIVKKGMRQYEREVLG